MGDKNIEINIYRIQAYDSIMGGYFCIGLISFMIKGKIILEYTNIFSSNEYKKRSNNIEIILITRNKKFLYSLKIKPNSSGSCF